MVTSGSDSNHQCFVICAYPPCFHTLTGLDYMLSEGEIKTSQGLCFVSSSSVFLPPLCRCRLQACLHPPHTHLLLISAPSHTCTPTVRSVHLFAVKKIPSFSRSLSQVAVGPRTGHPADQHDERHLCTCDSQHLKHEPSQLFCVCVRVCSQEQMHVVHMSACLLCCTSKCYMI